MCERMRIGIQFVPGVRRRSHQAQCGTGNSSGSIDASRDVLIFARAIEGF